jgi:hypothetical protein
MSRFSRPLVIGVLCAVPVALILWWFTNAIFDPAIADKSNFFNRAIGMGPLRGLAFGVGALLAAVYVAPRIAREDLGTFGGLFTFIGVGHLIGFVLVLLEITIRDPGILDPSVILSWPLAFVVTVATCMIVWLPTAGIWVAAVRSLTVEGLVPATDLERAQSEALRNAAARDHVITDATQLGDQGTKLYRNRG